MNDFNSVMKALATTSIAVVFSMGLIGETKAQSISGVGVGCFVIGDTGSCIGIVEAGHPQPYFFDWSTSGPVSFASSTPFNCSLGESLGDVVTARCPIRCNRDGSAGVTVEVFDANNSLIGVDSENFFCEASGEF